MTEQEHIGSVAMGDGREAMDAWLEANCGVGIPYEQATDQATMLHGLSYILRQIESTNSYRPHIGQCGPATSALRMALDHFASAALSDRPVQEPVAFITPSALADLRREIGGLYQMKPPRWTNEETTVALYLASPQPAHGTSATAGQGVEAALQRALDFIESLTADPLLLADDIEMNLSDVQSHARIELASIRKALSTPTPKEESK